MNEELLDLTIQIGMEALIGKSKEEARKAIGPLLKAGDFFLTQDVFLNVGGPSPRCGFFSVHRDGEEVLSLTFRDGLCIDQTLRAACGYHKIIDALRLAGFRYNVRFGSWTRKNSGYVWRVNEEGYVKVIACRRILRPMVIRRAA